MAAVKQESWLPLGRDGSWEKRDLHSLGAIATSWCHVHDDDGEIAPRNGQGARAGYDVAEPCGVWMAAGGSWFGARNFGDGEAIHAGRAFSGVFQKENLVWCFYMGDEPDGTLGPGRGTRLVAALRRIRERYRAPVVILLDAGIVLNLRKIRPTLAGPGLLYEANRKTGSNKAGGKLGRARQLVVRGDCDARAIDRRKRQKKRFGQIVGWTVNHPGEYAACCGGREV